MTIHITRLRVLYVCMTAALCLLAFATVASADDTAPVTPRAVPLARAIPRTFAGYEMLPATASAVANDQVTLYAQLLIAQAQTDTAKAALASVIDPRVRGGLVPIEANLPDEPAPPALPTHGPAELAVPAP